MKKTYITYRKDPRPIGPMTMFVHKPIRPDWVNETTYWYDSPQYDPPLSHTVFGEGYPIYHVEFDGFEFIFTSLDELRECIRVLSMKNLPSVLEYTKDSSELNSNWLSKLPGFVKEWKYREKATSYLQESLKEFATTN